MNLFEAGSKKALALAEVTSVDEAGAAAEEEAEEEVLLSVCGSVCVEMMREFVERSEQTKREDLRPWC